MKTITQSELEDLIEGMSNSSRFTIQVAGAISGDDPWACGYATYRGTWKTLQEKMPQIRREHGGNLVVHWYYRGQLIATGAKPFDLDIAFPREMEYRT